MNLSETVHKILAEGTDPAWDNLCHLAAQICGVPSAFIALYQGEQTLIKAGIGPALPSGPLPSFGMDQQRFIVIDDLAAIEGLRCHALVQQAPFWRFHAAVALVTQEGVSIGFLGVLDHKLRQLAPDQIAGLHRLAVQTMILYEACRLREADALVNGLIYELNHRVKNSLAVVQAIMSLTARSSASLAEFQSAFSARVGAFARVQSLLSNEHWRAIRLDAIVAGALEAYANRLNRPLAACGPPMKLPSDLAVMIGMALHELVANAAHYGAFSTPEGRFDLSWAVEQQGSCTFLRLDWREYGGPLVQKPEHQGFGIKLLEKVLGGQFHAKVDLAFRPEGFSVSLLIPLEKEDDNQLF